MKMFRFLIITAVLMNLFLSNGATQAQIGLPKGARTRIGNGTALSIAFSPDGTQLAVGTTIGIWIYDIPTYNVLSFLTGHAGYITAIEYSPDREILASGSSDTTIRLWNLHTGKNFAVLRGHKGSVNNIAFSSDSKTLVSNSSRERKILFWNLKIDLAKEHKAIAPEKSYLGNAFSMALSPDGETVAIGNVHPTVILWNMKLGLTKAMLDGHTWVPSDTQYAYPGSIHSLAFSPDGETLASSSTDTTIRLWDTKTAKHKVTLRRNGRDAPTLVFSPDGKTLASTTTGPWGANPMILLRDAATGRLKTTINNYAADALVFAPDNETLAGVVGDGTIWILNTKTGKQKTILTKHSRMRNTTRISPDGSTIANYNQDGTILLQDMVTEEQKVILKDFRFRINSNRYRSQGAFLRYSPNWKTLAITEGNIIRLWDMETGLHNVTLTGHTERVSAIAFSPNGELLASRTEDETIRLWNAKTGKQKAVYPIERRYRQFMVFSPDGKTLAGPVKKAKNMVQLWDTNTGHPHMLLEHNREVYSVMFSPDNENIITQGSGNTRLWDAKTGQLKVILNRPEQYNFSFMFSPDGKILVGYAKPWSQEKVDTAIWVWDAQTGRHKAKLTGHQGIVTHTLFASDSKTLVSTGSDTIIRLWDLETGQHKGMLVRDQERAKQPMSGANGSTVSTLGGNVPTRFWDVEAGQIRTTNLGYTSSSLILFAPDGKTLVSGGVDATIRFWDIETGQQKASFTGYTPVKSIVFTPDGKIMITQGIDGTILLWDLPQ